MTKLKIAILALACAAAAESSLAQQTDGLDEVFASRGKGQLTHREFDARMDRIPERDQAAFLRDGSRFERIVAELLLQKQLVVEAEAAGFHGDPMVQERVKLAAMTELATAWLDHRIATASDADLETMAKEEYLLTKDKLLTDETRDVSHILISTDERSEEEARLIADEVMSKLADQKHDWVQLVSEYSDDTASAANDGMYKAVKRGDMVPAFERAAFSMEPGEVSDPILTRYGFHIVHLEHINEPRQVSFEEIKTSLMEKKRVQHEKRVRIDYLTSFTSLETELTEEAVRTMLSRYVDDSLLSEVEPGDSE